MNKRLLISMLVFLLASCRLTNESLSYEYRNVNLDAITDTLVDPDFNRKLLPYKDSLNKVMSEVLAYSAASLVSFRPESPLSNLISDMALHYAEDYSLKNKLEIIPQFSLINHGSLRTSLSKGEITVGTVFELMPFENKLVLLQLSGKQVMELANYIATRGGEGVSGISFGIRSGRAEHLVIQGMRIDENLKYGLVTSDYIANGGDGMKILTWAEKRIPLNIRVRDMIIEVFKDTNKEKKQVMAKADGRLYYAE